MASITVSSEQGYRTAINIRQHTVIADELISDGGTDTGPTPMEILLGTAGACVVVTTKAYAQRKGWPLENVSVELEMERFKATDYPAYSGSATYVNEIREHVTFEGPLSVEQLERLHAIAAKCPVHQTLQNPVFFVQVDHAIGVGDK